MYLVYMPFQMMQQEVPHLVFPLVPGHEGVGYVTRCGNAVTKCKIGDRVGVGWMQDTCQQCEYCQRGQDNICTGMQCFLTGRPGSYAEFIVCREDLAHHIPTSISTVEAAPLLDAGITMWAPLKRYLHPGMHVGIVGIGGLGHLGLLLANSLGGHVCMEIV